MANKELTYAEAMAEIEQILARLRATELIASCKTRLRKAEADVNKVLE